MSGIIYGTEVERYLRKMGIYKEFGGEELELGERHDKRLDKREMQEQIRSEMDYYYNLNRMHLIKSCARIIVDNRTNEIGFSIDK